MTHSCVRYESCIDNEGGHLGDMTHLCVRHDSFTLVRMCDMTHMCDMAHMCDMTHSQATRGILATRLILVCAMVYPHSFMCQYSITLIHT